jgi:hypothetical protein
MQHSKGSKIASRSHQSSIALSSTSDLVAADTCVGVKLGEDVGAADTGVPVGTDVGASETGARVGWTVGAVVGLAEH